MSDAENRAEGAIRASIDALLKKHSSPLEGCGAYFWVMGRFYGVDGRLAVAIARAETSFATDPHMSLADLPGHNAWGFGHPLGGDPNKSALPPVATAPPMA